MADFILSAFADEIDPSLEIQMDELKKHGINHIEMRGVNGRNITAHNINKVKEIKNRLDERGFKISALGSPIGKIKITDEFESHLDLFKHSLDISKILDTSYIRMFSFFIPQGEMPEVYEEEVFSRWTKFIEASKGYDLTLLHENEKDIYADTPKRCLKLLKTMNCEYFKAVFDPANFVQCGVKTYPYAYELLEDYVVYFHIKDAKFEGHKVVPSGYGDGKIEEILKKAFSKGFKGFLSLEPHLGSFKGLQELELDISVKDMPEGGPKQFSIAANALKDILSRIQS